MKAIVFSKYGSSDVLKLKDIEKPVIKDDQVLVRVHAAGLNAGDIFSMRGSPWLVRFTVGFPKPKNYILGWDAAGRVETVGKKVTRFQPGDEVFASCTSALAEYACADEDNLAIKPSNLTFEQAAATPTAAVTALQGLRDTGKLQPGQKVLINGASGGVGTFAVQIAKAFEAEVTGICSTANHSFSDLRRTLTPHGIIIPNSGHGGMGYVIKAFLLSPFIHQLGKPYLASPNNKDLVALKELIEADKVTPVIDRVFPMSKTAEAFRYLELDHAQGKVVITMGHNIN